MTHKQLGRPLNIVVGILACIGIGAAATHYLLPEFLHAAPLIVALHVILAGVWMTVAPFQFMKRIRSRWLNYHRWAGRTLVAIGPVIALAALLMASSIASSLATHEAPVS